MTAPDDGEAPSGSGLIIAGNDHGLGARLRTIAAGRLLAKVAHKQFVCIWPLSAHCGSEASDPERLFTNVDVFVPSRPWEGDAWGRRVDNTSRWAYYKEELLAEWSKHKPAFDFTTPLSPDFERFRQLHGHTIEYVGRGQLLCREAWFEPELGRELNRINPSPDVMARVDGFATQRDLSHCIGVHVRRGDIAHPKNPNRHRCIDEAQYFDFIDSLEELSNRSIFLCTESAEVADNFAARYGERIFSRPVIDKHRASIEGLQDAYADMILLGRCERIVGGFSNFSKMAALMGGKARHTLTQSPGF